jgi:S-formylglutathione hydrolase FrmB
MDLMRLGADRVLFTGHSSEEMVHGPGLTRPVGGRSRPVSPAAAIGLTVVALGLVATVYSGLADQVAIDAPGFVSAAAAVAVIGMVVGVADRGAKWWATWGLANAAMATAVVAAAHWWVSASGLVADHYPPTILVWVWLGVWAVGVGMTGWWSGAAVIRVARLLTAPVAVTAAFLLVNAHYGYWPTVGVLLGRPVAGQVSAPQINQDLSLRSTISNGAHPWAATRTPRTGLYGPITVPSAPVAFPADPTWLWVPPAYFQSRTGQFPVLLMLTGLPGTSHDWVTAGQVVSVADAWASHHQGFAPVMIFVDENGRGNRDTECVNGPQGQAESYLTQDIPDWVDTTLGIRPDPSSWGVVGFSEGGTCALDLATQHPDLFGTFVDIAGDRAPNHGDAAATLHYLFGDNLVGARSSDPGLILASHRFSRLDGWFAAGTGDRSSLAVLSSLSPLAARAGIVVHLFEAPGGHTWIFARKSFAAIYPALVTSVSGPAPALTATPEIRHGPATRHRLHRSESHKVDKGRSHQLATA